MSKYSKGDVVRLNHYAFGNRNGQLASVVSVCDEGSGVAVITVRMGDGLAWEVSENTVIGVTLDELRAELGDHPAPSVIVDRPSAEEAADLEAGQEVVYEFFRTAAKEAKKAKYRTILWAVFMGVALAMIFLTVFTGNKIFSAIGLMSSLLGTPFVTTRMVDMFFVCREEFKELRKRNPRNMK